MAHLNWRQRSLAASVFVAAVGVYGCSRPESPARAEQPLTTPPITRVAEPSTPTQPIELAQANVRKSEPTSRPSAVDPDLQDLLNDNLVASHWIYNDFAKARARAKQSGKPMMVVLRCVP